MTGWLGAIIIGALCGWIASMVMKTDAQQGAVANILIGIVGAALANLLFGNLLNLGANFNGFLPSLLWGTLGSIILIALLKALKVLK